MLGSVLGPPVFGNVHIATAPGSVTGPIAVLILGINHKRSVEGDCKYG